MGTVNLPDDAYTCWEVTEQISFFKLNFWDLWLQKVFRNFASAKYQWMIYLFVATVWGMYTISPNGKPWVSALIGFGFLGAGFVTFSISRLLANTSLKEDSDILFNTDSSGLGNKYQNNMNCGIMGSMSGPLNLNPMGAPNINPLSVDIQSQLSLPNSEGDSDE